MKTPSSIQVIKADYLDGYRLRVTFNDGKVNDIDFSDIVNHLKGYYSKYQKPVNFKKFKVDEGNVVWGSDWDLIFPVHQLYKNHLTKN